MPMAVATSSSRAAVALKRRGHPALFERFAVVVTAEDVSRGKPKPDVFLEAARQLGVPPQQCLVFEDALSGVQAGLAAGCAVVAVPDQRLHLDQSAFQDATEVLPSLQDFQPQRWGMPPFEDMS